VMSLAFSMPVKENLHQVGPAPAIEVSRAA
jgi:hypothetical protein